MIIDIMIVEVMRNDVPSVHYTEINHCDRLFGVVVGVYITWSLADDTRILHNLSPAEIPINLFCHYFAGNKGG